MGWSEVVLPTEKHPQGVYNMQCPFISDLKIDMIFSSYSSLPLLENRDRETLNPYYWPADPGDDKDYGHTSIIDPLLIRL